MQAAPSHPTISAIVAMAENRVIGKDNQLPWHLPADLKHFKTLTTGNLIMMGRKTYESIGKALPNRVNIIFTHNNTFQAPGCLIATTLEEVIAYAEKASINEIFIIGGAQIFNAFLSQVSRIYLTIVHHHFEGDVYFPALDLLKWQQKSVETYPADEKNPYSYSFILLERNC